MPKQFELNGAKVELTKAQLQEMLSEYDKPVYDYPLAVRSNTSKSVVLFTSLDEGKIIYTGTSRYAVGYASTAWATHTDTDHWTPIPYDKERGLFDKQPVVCWDNDEKLSRTIRFYATKNSNTFSYTGRRNSSTWDNYLPYHGDLLGMNPEDLED